MPITLKNSILRLGVAGMGFRGGHPFLTANITNFAAQPVTYQFALPAGKVMIIEWGDGASSTVTGPVGATNYAHTYAANGTYQTRLRGDYRSLTHLSINNSYVSGSTAILSVFSSLGDIYLNNSGITGSVINLSPMTILSTLFIGATAITGTTADIGLFANNLINIYINSTNIAYSPALAPKWRGGVYVYNLAWPQAHVDAFLAECVTAGYSGAYTLHIAGSNAAPSVEGLDSRDILVSRGWTVTVTA